VSGELLNLKFITIESLQYEYSSKNSLKPKNIIGATITKVANWRTDFKLSYNFNDKTIEATANTPPATRIEDESINKSIQILPFSILLGLSPPSIGLRLPFIIHPNVSDAKTFHIELKVTENDIRGDVTIDLINEWTNPLGLCSLLNIREDYIAIAKDIGFGLGLSYESGIPDYLRFEGGIRINEMRVKSAFVVDLNPASSSIRLNTEMRNISFNDIVSSAFYIMTGKEFDSNTASQFELFKFESVLLDMNVGLKNLLDSGFTLDISNMQILQLLTVDTFFVHIDRSKLEVKCEIEPFHFGCVAIEPVSTGSKIKA